MKKVQVKPKMYRDINVSYEKFLEIKEEHKRIEKKLKIKRRKDKIKKLFSL